MNIHLSDTFNKDLPSDPKATNDRRQVHNACYSFVTPKKTSNPEIIHISQETLNLLGIENNKRDSEDFLNIFTGNKIIKNSHPYAMCYGGHQFGNWAGQLGDGRAINLGEVVHENKRWAIQLKGAGETPYSRTADGLAVLRSSIREHLCSEAMFHLGVPTTRSLSLALSGDKVLRDIMYNGNPAMEKGAIVCRVSPSFIRFGSFEILSSRKDHETLKKLANYTINTYYPEFNIEDKYDYLQLFKKIADENLEMVLNWQRVGFVHGVMNTDNMSIHGITIDYGPYGWLEGYDPSWTPNTTDKQYKRYQFGNQPNIVLWNLYKLANAIYPLVNAPEGFEKILNDFVKIYDQKYLCMMRNKLGFTTEQKSDKELIEQLENTLQLTETDMTIFFRNLSSYDKNKPVTYDMNTLKPILDAFYKTEELDGDIIEEWNDWIKLYLNRLKEEKISDQKRKEIMNKVNPKYVLRNYMSQLAIDDAEKGNYHLIEELHQLLKKPYDEQPKHQKWFAKRPEWARNKVGCSMLSCSS